MNTAQDHDYRTEDQKVAAVAASMTMAGQPVTPETELEGRRILRGEISADQSVLNLLEQQGYGNTPRAQELRRRIATGE
ncbi:antitoxin VbhA family protein [uncultured Corynebacterium sp.]|uniref:antitoxin VbhA family protein n=1 Tax=uncultured Corynebacterium sp. TaxID=159447 RepID=UPI0025F9C19C|nr:antitoxin VbhA family protein [uncultured Corynebacterium sp.]